MILKNITINNFRAATDVSIPFSYDNPEKPVTIIRAENKTGKTTILNALLWGIFGEAGLNNQGKEYRISNLNYKPGSHVTIEVTIDFEHTYKKSPITGEVIDRTADYRLIRSNIEKIDENGRYERNQRIEELNLYELTEAGTQNQANPQEKLNRMLGSNVKNLFFTNGDDTLNFIESPNRKTLVKGAIKDMMSFDIVEKGMNHIKTVSKDLLNETKGSSEKFSLKEIAKLRLLKEDEVETQVNNIKTLETNLNLGLSKYKKIQDRLHDALKLGNKEELLQEQDNFIALKNSLTKSRNDIANNHAQYFYSNDFTRFLTKKWRKKTALIIAKKVTAGELPKASQPYLKKILKNGVCICGTKFEKEDSHYVHIMKLITEQENASNITDRMVELKVTLDNERIIAKTEFEKFIQLTYEKENELAKNIENTGVKILEIDNKIKSLPDEDVIGLKNELDSVNTSNNHLTRSITTEEIKLDGLEIELKNILVEYDNIANEEGKKSILNSKISAASDIFNVLDGVFKDIEDLEIPKVANNLNNFFMEMIATEENVGDAQSGATIDDYEIQVIGPNGNYLHLPQDLNGASLRALTLSFIMALTKVCEFIAPNIIDTPFGMMSPNEKHLAIKTLSENSNQLILFLTRSEINNIESDIDNYAGSVTTMINTSKITELINDPGGLPNTILTCNCNHKEHCKQCEHRYFGGNN